MKNKAVELFRAEPRMYNCAQAVAAAAGRVDMLDELRCCGGGKAPDNLCGALFAAMGIAGEKNSLLIREKFCSELNADTCAKLKGEVMVPCARCVAVAAELLEKYGR